MLSLDGTPTALLATAQTARSLTPASGNNTCSPAPVLQGEGVESLQNPERNPLQEGAPGVKPSSSCQKTVGLELEVSV